MAQLGDRYWRCFITLIQSVQFTQSWSLLKLMSVELVMPSNYLILCYRLLLLPSVFPSSVQSLSYVRLFATPWTAVHQASLSITNSQNLLSLMSIESVMPSNHLILCRPLLLLPSVFPSIRVFSNESVLRIRWPKYWSFSLFWLIHLYKNLGVLCITTCMSY